MATKKRINNRSKKPSKVTDLTAKSTRKVKGGATSKNPLSTDAVAGDLKSTVKF